MHNRWRLAAWSFLSAIATCAHAGTPAGDSDVVLRLKSIIAASAGAERAWPGYRFLSTPFLLVDRGRSEALAGTLRDVQGFAPSLIDPQIMVSSQPAEIGLFRRNFRFAGITVMAVEYSAPQSPTKTAALAIHEKFHDYQSSWPVPIDEKEYPEVTADDLALSAVEQIRLSSAAATGDRDALLDFLAIRAWRYEVLPQRRAELAAERNEGSARFVEMAATRSDQHLPEELRKRLQNPPGIEDLKRWRSYETGAAICMALERLEFEGPWQSKIERGESPYDVLRAAIPMSLTNRDRRMRAILDGSGYSRRLDSAKADLEKMEQEKRAALLKFAGQQGVRLRVSSSSGKLPNVYYSAARELRVPQGRLLDPAKSFEIHAPGIDLALDNQTILYGDYIEFVLPATTTMFLDGKRLPAGKTKGHIMDLEPAKNNLPRKLEITGPARIDLSSATVRSDGDVFDISIWP